MMELSEAFVLSKQINQYLQGKKIVECTADHSPHKFAWYHGDPKGYKDILVGKKITNAKSVGGMLEITIEDASILLSDGTKLCLYQQNDEKPSKHQLLLVFEEGMAISVSIQMYGGIWCFDQGDFDNGYYTQAKTKPSPLSDDFDKAYFMDMVDEPKNEKLSAKALLATEQRIPGLGNGVLQDILFNAGIHPQKKIQHFSEQEREQLFLSIKNTLKEMIDGGGRDTEKDLLGNPGGYVTKLSKNTVDTDCKVCGNTIQKKAYMGGSVYFCEGCQILSK